jgi:hypothetical protein
MEGEISPIPISTQGQLRSIYFDFFKDFKEYLAEYIRESVTELSIAEIRIRNSVQIFDGFTHGKVVIKNQGKKRCYITTQQIGGYRLDPDEKVEFYVNSPVTVCTISGTQTTIGLIKY